MVARIFERSGRDDVGTGGGALFIIAVSGLGSLPLAISVIGSSDLFIPNDNADLDTGGRSRGGSFL